MKGFDPACTECPRLAAHLKSQRKIFPNYFNRPVPAFGSKQGNFLIVGLAPGLHGANRTGRPFTGDHAGILLYEALHQSGFSNRVGSAEIDDGLQLLDCRITNAVKCLPPANKPLTSEVHTCNAYLVSEIAQFRPRAILALGVIAHGAVLRALRLRASDFRFAHGARHRLVLQGATDGMTSCLFDSYHCSRYNTQTKRLTTDMFTEIFRNIREFLGAAA